MKIVINTCYGGFSVSKAVYDELGFEWDGFGYPSNEDFDIRSNNIYAFRSDERLIHAIEKVGIKKSSGSCADLKIIDIPNGIDFDIDYYDGVESVHEVHRYWN